MQKIWSAPQLDMNLNISNWKKRNKVTVLCLAVIPLSMWLMWERMIDIRYKPIKVTGTIQAKEIAVASKIGGRILSLKVREGQEVKAGDVILEFEEPELEARKRQLTDQIEMYRAQLKEMINGPRPKEILEAKAACEEAQAKYDLLREGYRIEDIQKAKDNREEAEANLQLLERGYRKEDVARAKAVMDECRIRAEWYLKDALRYERLAREGAISKRDAEDLRIRYCTAQRIYLAAKQEFEKQTRGPRTEEIRAARERLESLQNEEKRMTKGFRKEEIEAGRQEYLARKAHYDLLLEGTRQEQIEIAQANLKRAEATLEELDAQLKDRCIIAPALSEVSVMDLHKGELIPANKSVITLTRLDDVWTRVYIPARELARVSMDMHVDVKVDSFPGRVFKGRVVQIPSVAEFTPRNVQTAEERSAQVFGLKIQIDNPHRLLRGGMNAEIIFPPVTGPFTTIAGNNNGKSNSVK